MIKIQRNPVPPVSLAIEKAKNGSYNQKDVIEQLYNDFYEKCYLCEINELQSAEVEHLIAHGGNLDLKFDWNNLFLSCRHCNSIKNTKEYASGILDCCRIDPELYLEYILSDAGVVVKPKTEDSFACKTACLLTDCFEKRNTGIREYTCDVRVRALKMTMTLLYKTLSDYKKGRLSAIDELKVMLDRSYKFAGFTRAYVRRNLERYPELEILVA